jgi:hypothetical protein
MRLKDRRTNSCDFSSLAAKIAGSTDLLKASMGSRKFGKRGKSSLSCRLFGSIHIDDQPMVTLAIPQATRRKGLGGSQDQIVEKQRAQRLDGWLIQSGKIATQSAAMGQALATKERHKGLGKRLKSLIKCEQGWFCTHRVSDEDGDKIHEFIGPESRTRKTDLFLDVFEDARCDEDLRHDGDLSKPVGN